MNYKVKKRKNTNRGKKFKQSNYGKSNKSSKRSKRSKSSKRSKRSKRSKGGIIKTKQNNTYAHGLNSFNTSSNFNGLQNNI